MSNPKSALNLTLVVFSILILQSTISAQNTLSAKANSIQPVNAAVESDRLRDGLAGPVRRVRTEVAKLSNNNGRSTEDKRVVLEIAAYDPKGTKTENQYFPVAGATLTGREVYKYDERGNISEMTLLNSDGSLLGKEVYKYDYDTIGNWTKMTTSVAVVESGKVTFEPSEVTYRSIMYYLDENMLKMAQPGSPAANVEANLTAANTAKAESKSQPVVSTISKSQPANKPGAASGNNKDTLPLPAVNTSAKSNAFNANVLASGSATPTTSKGTTVVLDSEPPAVSTPKPLLKPVSGGVLNGKAVNLPSPTYPDTAKRMRMGGIVTVEVVVDETGNVISAQATSGPTILREPAIQAALKAKFSSTKLSGQPVKVTGVINYRFSLSQ